MRRLLRSLLFQLSSLFRNGTKEAELDEEVQYHVDRIAQDFEREGMSPDEARKAALKEFGNVEAIKEGSRESWGTHWLFSMVREFRLGLRLLWKSKGFTAAVVLTLSICIIGNTVVFSILDGILKPPSYPDPDKVFEIFNTYPELYGSSTKLGGAISRASYLDYSENAEAFESMAYAEIRDVNVSINDVLLRTRGLYVTKKFFDVVSIAPVKGRYFVESDFFDNNENASSIQYPVVIAESFWKNQLGGDGDILGKTIYLNSLPNFVIGVAPDSVSNHLYRPQVFRALPSVYRMTEDDKMRGRFADFGGIFARVKAEVGKDQAKAQIDALDQRYFERTYEGKKEFIKRSQHETKMATYQEMSQANEGKSLYLLQFTVLVVLLIGCLNVANLLIARGIRRGAEFAIRNAVGASEVEILRQVLMECLAIAFISCIFGSLLVLPTFSVVNHYFITGFFPDYYPDTVLRLNKSSTFFFIGISSVAGILLGVFALTSYFLTRRKFLNPLQEHANNATSNKTIRRVASILVSTQVALSVVLLISAGLFIRSFFAAIISDPGIGTKNIYVSKVGLTWADWKEPERISEFRRRLRSSLQDTPGIEAVAFSLFVPVAESLGTNGNISLPDVPDEPSSELIAAKVGFVSEGFFEMLGINLLTGRYFEANDANRDGGTIVIDRAFTEKYFKGVNPLGKYLGVGSSFNVSNFNPKTTPLIVGVVENIQHHGLDKGHGAWGAGNLPMYYALINNSYLSQEYTLIVKSSWPQNELYQLIQDKVREIDPRLPVYFNQPLERAIGTSLNQRRIFMLLVTILGFLALILSAIGIYGVIAFDVNQRTREIGLRMALGASRKGILKLILQQGAGKIALGVFFGLIGAFLLSERIGEFLYEVKPTDPLGYILVTVFVLIIAFFPSYLPARRASRIQPMDALRAE